MMEVFPELIGHCQAAPDNKDIMPMITKNVTMHSKVFAYLVNIVHEEAIPVNIDVGARHKDYNDDIQVDVLLEYEEKDEDCVGAVMTRAVNMAIDFLSNIN